VDAHTNSTYRGRLAPSPTGFLHLGHARTFWTAAQRAQAAGGQLVFRCDDLDRDRCRPEFAKAALEDLRWLGLSWSEGPDLGGPFSPYAQSERLGHYRLALQRLYEAGFLFPCTHSRRDVLEAAGAPHEGGDDDEPLYPREFRPSKQDPLPPLNGSAPVNWRFRVPDGETIAFVDGACGPQQALAGSDFGDFIVWRKDDTPSYQLACAVDDALMGITEVVRGCDLIKSTFRQLLLFRALGWQPPAFFHCPLVNDGQGRRLAKRHDALSLSTLREQGLSAAQVVERFSCAVESASSFCPH
jgi:glutamyl-tRNA synthetase